MEGISFHSHLGQYNLQCTKEILQYMIKAACTVSGNVAYIPFPKQQSALWVFYMICIWLCMLCMPLAIAAECIMGSLYPLGYI